MNTRLRTTRSSWIGRARVLLSAALLLDAADLSIARADDPPPPAARCPQGLSCTKAGEKVAGYRRSLRQLRSRLEATRNAEQVEDEAAVERQITELRDLSSCKRCPKKLRGAAFQVQAGLEGLLAKHYDSWGTKRGVDGRRSFRATRQAALVDPQSLPAWTSYGKALVAIDGKTFKGRIAKYLAIDLPVEMESASSNLARLLAHAPADSSEAQATLDALKRSAK